MAAAVVVSGQASLGLASTPDNFGRDQKIRPDGLAMSLARSLNLKISARDSSSDVVISMVRRDALSIVAGLAVTITPARSAASVAPKLIAGVPKVRTPVSRVAATGNLNTPPTNSIVATDDVIVAPVEHTPGARAISAVAVASLELPSVVRSAATNALVEQDVDQFLELSAFDSGLLSLVEEAQGHQSRSSDAAVAMSEYLSLYVLKDRAAEVGKLLLAGGSDDAATVWAVDFSDNAESALAREGLTIGQEVDFAAGGFDFAESDVLALGDRLIYGGFASAFSMTTAPTFAGFTSDPDRRGGSLGFYGVYDRGPWTVSGMLRADMSETFDNNPAARIDFSDTMRSMKAELTARYRKDVGGLIVEPSAGLSYANISQDAAPTFGSQLRFEKAESLSAKIGVKVSSVVYNKSGVAVEPSVTISLSKEILGSNGDVTFLTGSPTGDHAIGRGRTVGEVSVNVDVLDTELGLRGFVKADGKVTDDDKQSVGVSAGVRTNW